MAITDSGFPNVRAILSLHLLSREQDKVGKWKQRAIYSDLADCQQPRKLKRREKMGILRKQECLKKSAFKTQLVVSGPLHATTDFTN
jgi:hypothetical protein